MSLLVIVGHNILEPASWSHYENVPNFGKFLLEEFAPMYGGQFPKTARIYHEQCDREHDVTPATPAAAEALRDLQGTVYVLVHPAEPVSSAILVNVAVTLGLLAIKFAINSFFPDKKDRTHEIRQGSPNNTLGDRLNTARLGERIPDIYGRVRSVPDLVQVPYITYENHRQVETSLMCVGTGQFAIPTLLEGETNTLDIPEMSVRIYPPGQAPGGGTPQLPLIGPDIDDPAFTVIPIRAVKGDVLLPLNARTITGRIRRTEKTGLRINSPRYQYDGAGVGRIVVEWDHSPEEVTDKIQLGDQLFVDWPLTHGNTHFFPFTVSTDPEVLVAGTGAQPDLGSPDMVVDGGELLTITAINDTFLGFNSVEIIVDVPAPQQAEWALISTYSPVNNFVHNFLGSVTPVTGYWHGPFFCDDPGPHPNGQQIYCNFVAERGLFADDGKTQHGLDQDVAVVVYPASSSGTISGTPEIFVTTVRGSYTDRTTRAQTFIINSATPRSDPVGVGLTIQGRFIIYARRLTLTHWRESAYAHPRIDTSSFVPDNLRDLQIRNFESATPTGPFGTEYLPKTGLIQDEIRWTNCYSMSRPPNPSFGDVTLIHTRTVARKDTQQRLSERRLNGLVTRMIETWNGATYGGAPSATVLGLNAFFDILTRSAIGNVPDAQIDFAGIAAAFEAVEDHIADGTGRAAIFQATFDEDNISLEEMLVAVADCCFCVAYREGNIIKARPDIDTDSSVLLFNHRNKIPDSEQRSMTFGTDEDYDGVEVNYFDDTDDRVKTYFVPSEGTALKPRKISVLGLRTKAQAQWHAWRAYNRLLFQNTTTEFEALEEAALAVIRDRILVADNTKGIPVTMDGYVKAISGTTITTSQPVNDDDAPNTIFLQHTDGTVESIAVASIPDQHHVVLATAPSVTLVTDDSAGVPTGYLLVSNAETLPTAFTVVEKTFKQLGVYGMTAVNYTAAYYMFEGLHLWFQLAILVDRPTLDSSPYEVVTTITGITTAVDGTRGTVFEGTANTNYINCETTPYTDYTKAVWINKDNTGVEPAQILGSPGASTQELFQITATGDTLQGIHGGVTYVSFAGFPIAAWTHAAITYDSVADVMRLYVNGELVDEATSVPSPAFVALRQAFGRFLQSDGLIGRADDLRLYQRVLSPSSIRDLYQRTRKI